MNNVRFSIIVPIYNVEEYLVRCLDSIMDQNFINYEVILVDDESPDRCPILCDEYATRYSNVSVIHKKNGGLSDARNVGIKASIGEYIIFVDSDDFIDKDALNIFNNELTNKRNIDILAANSTRIEKKIKKKESYYYISNIVDGPEFLKNQLNHKQMHFTAWRNVYRRDFLVENKLYFKHGILHEDEQWTPRVFLKAKKVLLVDYSFYGHCIREGSITQNKVKTRNARDIIETCNELMQTYNKIDDIELKKYLNNHLVGLYLHAIYIGKFIGRTKPEDIKYLSGKFLVKYSMNRANHINSIIYSISDSLYFWRIYYIKSVKQLALYKFAKKIFQ